MPISVSVLLLQVHRGTSWFRRKCWVGSERAAEPAEGSWGISWKTSGDPDRHRRGDLDHAVEHLDPKCDLTLLIGRVRVRSLGPIRIYIGS
jgi:hypothetical protein